MKSASLPVLAIFAVALLAAATSANAYWVENGTAVCSAANYQGYSVITQDGIGGYIVAWIDNRNGNSDIYAQRLNASGTPLWAANGVAVNTDVSAVSDLQICADGMGGAILVWTDYRNGNDDIYAQRIASDGTMRWFPDGYYVCYETSQQSYPYAVPDGAGGAIIVWQDWRNGNLDVYAQHMDAGGYPRWYYSGVGVCTASSNQTWIRPVPDGSGGAVLTWMDLRSGNYDIYAQRVNGAGASLWTAGGVPICTLTSVEGNPSITQDDAGGFIITWMDQRSGGGQNDIYAQRLNAAGAIQWTANGVAVCAQPYSQHYSYCVGDGAGGAVITWLDDRLGDSKHQVYAQRIDYAGAARWTANGVNLSSLPFGTMEARVVSDGGGGGIVSWLDGSIKAQHVDGAGTKLWGENGRLICGSYGSPSAPRIAPNGAGGAVIVWPDDRAGSNDIYAAHVEGDGDLYDPAPSIAGIADIPADEGGKIWLAWDASRDETLIGNLVTHYTIWRAIDPAAAALAGEEGRPLLAAGDGIPADLLKGTVRIETLGATLYYWQLIETQDIYYQPTYGLPIETLYDSTEAGTGYHYFQVVAQTIYPTMYFASAPDSGYSVDNLSPCAPLCLAGEQSFVPEGLVLSWKPNTEPDLDVYRVYRDVDPTFEPGPGNLLVSLCDTTAFDGDWSWDSGFCYKVSAVDVHGNESGYALLCSDGVTGVEPARAPDATFLAQNWPNPFNPATTIAFGLVEPGHVSLRVYDAAGRLVATLVEETRPAGLYRIDWDGRSHDGAPAASGVYFYKLRARAFEETKKMVLLR